MPLISQAMDELCAVDPPFAVGDPISAEDAMSWAVIVAYKGCGRVHTNPLVGAVAVDREHRFLGWGMHAAYGEAHAEQMLIEQLRSKDLLAHLEGGQVYVTLEPCAHIGKTPSCAQLLSQFPIAKVIYAHKDRNLLVNGSGLDMLVAAGIKVESNAQFAKMAAPLSRAFFHNLDSSRPYVGMKVAASLNHVIAYQGDQRAWITGQRARSYGHWLRVLYDAILVGADTQILDNPELSPRHSCYGNRQALRVVLDPKGRALKSRPYSEHRLLVDQPKKTLWVFDGDSKNDLASEAHVLEKLGAGVFFSKESMHESLDDLMVHLKELGIQSLLLEGGLGVWQSFLNQALVDCAHLFYAPRWLCEKEALRMTPQNLEMESPQVTPLDGDFVLEGALKSLAS